MTAAEIVKEMEAEIKRRDEWYGLDNWPVSEVVQFVLDRLDQSSDNERKELA